MMNVSSTSTAASTSGRITEATLRLMAERGLGGVTMKAVAEAAGIARQTLYNHFPDVESIVGAAIEAHQAESIAALSAVLTAIQSPKARLEHLVRHAAAAAVHHQPVGALQHGLSPGARESLQRHDAEILAIIEDTLRRGRSTGDFRSSIDIYRDARLIKRILEGAAALSSADSDSVLDTVAVTTRTLLSAVTSGNAGASGAKR